MPPPHYTFETQGEHVHIKNYFVICFVLVVFVVLTIIHGTISVLFGTLFWLAYYSGWKVPLHWNPVRHQGTSWLWNVWHGCFRPLGQTASVSSDYPPEPLRTPGLKIILVSPHPSTLETILAAFAARLVARWVVVSMKGWYFWLPIIGQAAWATGCAVFIIRLHDLKWVQRRPKLHAWLRDVSMRRIRNKMLELRSAAEKAGEPIAFVIFPDSRWRKSRFEEQLIKYASTIPGLASWIDQMLVGRSGALLEALQQAGDMVEVIDLTMVGHRQLADGWTNFSALFNTRWLLAYRNVTAELVEANGGDPDLRKISETALRQWLNEVRAPWVVEHLIRPWRTPE